MRDIGLTVYVDRYGLAMESQRVAGGLRIVPRGP